MKKNSLIVNVFVIILLSILLVISLFSIFSPTNFMGISNWLSPLCLIGSTVAILLILYWTVQFLRKHPNLSKIFQCILIFILIAIQIYVAISFVDYGRADSFYVRNQAYMLAHSSKHWMSYFEIYPNNVFCAFWISLIIKLSIIFHLKSPWMLINFIQFGWLDLGLWASIFLLKKWARSYLTPLLIFIWIITAPFYGYALFVYTDIWVLPVPLMVAAILEMHFPSKLKWLKFILLNGLLVFAAKMKGNFWILLIAVIMGLGISGIINHNFSKFRNLIITLIPVLLIFSMGMNEMQKTSNYHSTNKALPVTHWIAMSSDPNSHGDYIKKETLNEIALPTKKSRAKVDTKLIFNNIEKMGIFGFIKHSAAKLQLLSSSGTFGFERTTRQWKSVPNWFYKYQSTFRIRLANISQIEYLVLLFGAIIYLMSVPADKKQLILEIFMIGIIVFHSVLWESEERYGLPLLPILIILGILGIDGLGSKHKCVSKINNLNKIVLTIISVFFIGTAIVNLPIDSNGYVTGQNIGSYLADEQIKLNPHHTLTTTIKLPIRAHRLILFPIESNQKIKARVTQRNTLIAKINSTKQLETINISRAYAGYLRVKLYNPTTTPIDLKVGKAAYPIASSSIKNHSHTYLQYQIEQ